MENDKTQKDIQITFSDQQPSPKFKEENIFNNYTYTTHNMTPA